MRLLIITALCGSIGVAAHAVRGAGHAESAKCRDVKVRFPDAPEPVYVLDGKAVHADSLPQLDRDRIESVEIVCADVVHEMFGIKARRNGVVIFTAPGPRALLKVALDDIAQLQHAYRTRTGRFAKSIDKLGWSDPAGLITIELKVADDGETWTAAGRHRYIGKNTPPLTTSGRAAVN